MDCILCVDNSGSTSNVKVYWDKIARINELRKPNKLIYWNTSAQYVAQYRQYSEGGTSPECFLTLLERQTKPYDLIITTDGEIADRDIDNCSRKITNNTLSLINSTIIFYIGNERSMNIGLNVIFGRTKKMSYHINDQFCESLIEKFDALDVGDLMSPNFAISIIVHIKNFEAAYQDRATREKKISELRGEICKLYSRLEHKSIDSSLTEKLEEYFRSNRMQEFVDVLTKDRLDVMSVSKQKTAILNIFDKKIDFNISRIAAATAIRQQDIEVKPEEDGAWSDFEDVITLDKFSLPCLLVQNCTEPFVSDKNVLKHPFKLLSEPELIKKIMLLVEPNPIDYRTYEKLDFDRSGYTVSPYTRVPCKGVFAFDTSDMKVVKNNCRSISVLFSDHNKVPGSAVLWNLVITYLLYKHKFYDTEYKSVILEQIIEYCKNFTCSLSFTHHCQVLRPMRIEVSLWYCLRAAPTVIPNTAKNVLRSVFGRELVEFYSETFGRDSPDYVKQISYRTDKWAVWNYMLVRKGTPDMDLEVRAQYQNYCVYKNSIILLSGRCQVPYASKLNLLDADTVYTMHCNMKDSSSKIDIVDLQTLAATVQEHDSTSVPDSLTHVKINIKTCWPTVVCPVTKVHWKQCMGEYDVKTESHVRVFNRYCAKYKKYPEHHMDLALLSSRINRNSVIKTLDISRHVFGLFEEVMRTYTCEQYLSIYQSYIKEEQRLTME